MAFWKRFAHEFVSLTACRKTEAALFGSSVAFRRIKCHAKLLHFEAALFFSTDPGEREKTGRRHHTQPPFTCSWVTFVSCVDTAARCQSWGLSSTALSGTSPQGGPSGGTYSVMNLTPERLHPKAHRVIWPFDFLWQEKQPYTQCSSKHSSAPGRHFSGILRGSQQRT